ncbi:MAG: hypothetical protein QOD84_2130 [Acidobacteriaceae bacterium]|jgi:ketosteroid isomerase-like protein
MHRRSLAILICVFALSLSSVAAHSHKRTAKKVAGGPAPDKAFLQKIWDGWGTLDPAHQTQFYAQGDHTFFDVAPLKYKNWQEYQVGVAKELAGYKSATFTVNDDLEIHPAGEFAWGASTVKEDAVLKNGKREMGTFRWTFVLAWQDGKWLIVHEHVSEPAQ